MLNLSSMEFEGTVSEEELIILKQAFREQTPISIPGLLPTHIMTEFSYVVSEQGNKKYDVEYRITKL